MFSRFRRSSRSVRFEENGKPQTHDSHPSGENNDGKPPMAPEPTSAEEEKRVIDEEVKKMMRRPSLARRLSNSLLRRKSSVASHSSNTDQDVEVTEADKAILISWGRNDYGQLLHDPLHNTSPDDDESNLTHLDTSMEALRSRSFESGISDVSTGLYHTLASTSRGMLWGAGDNEDGQLESSKPTDHFQVVKLIKAPDSLIGKPTASLAVGLKHSAAVTRDGITLTWGSNESGQLGHSKDSSLSVPPKQLDGNVRRERMVQVACSEGATFLLSEKGQVWSTGEGTRGELGRPEVLETGCSWLASPVLGRLFCSPISVIATGAAHVIAVTVTGNVLGWGWNRHGQLGFVPNQARYEAAPVSLKTGDASITSAACGASHTALVTSSGTVLTAGANDFAQLGHDPRDEYSFGEVQGLSEDTVIVKAVSGSFHTLLLTSMGKVYGYGSNEFGEVDPFSASKPLESNSVITSPILCLGDGFVIDVMAGGRSSFALVAKDSADGPILMRAKQQRRPKLQSLDAKTLIKLVSEANSLTTLSGLKGALLEFHPTGFNRAFLSKSSKSQVDVEGVITALDAVWGAMTAKKEGERHLVQRYTQLHAELVELAAVATEPDQLRAFFIALLNPACEHMPSGVYSSLVRAVASLKEESLNMIASWSVADCSPEIFTKRLLDQLLRVLEFAAEKRDWSLRGCAPLAMRILTRLYEHSNAVAGGRLVSFEKFYIHQPDKWAQHVMMAEWRRYVKRDRNARSGEKDFSLFEYPFVLSAELKRQVMMYDQQNSQLQQAVITALRQSGSPFFEITVRREHLLEDAFRVLLTARKGDLTKPLRVIFDGEPGLDWGGVAKEFFELLSKNLFDPNARDLFYHPDPEKQPDLLWLNARGKTAKMLQQMDSLLAKRKERSIRNDAGTNAAYQLVLADAVHCPQQCAEGMVLSTLSTPCVCDVCGSGLHVGQQTYSCRTCNYDVCQECRLEENPEASTVYREVVFVGLLMGLAVYHSILLDVHFPLALYAGLLDQPILNPSLQDLSLIDPSLAHGLKVMLDFPAATNEEFEDSFGEQVFYIEDADFELIPDGKKVTITRQNRALYVQKRCEFEVRDGVSGLLSSLMTGFRYVVDVQGDALRLFSPPELELMIAGVPELDFSALRKVATYEAFDESSPIVHAFWDICENELTFDQQRQLLHFITGSGKAPVGGLGNQVILIQRAGPDSDQLPTAHTCFNTLLLPEYPSKEKLRQKLLVAINNSQGFGLQ